MKHVIEIIEIKHLAKDGRILWEDHHLPNMLHLSGEVFILNAIFAGLAIPPSYYFGLDNRIALNDYDTLTDVHNYEASGNGYVRQSVSSTGQFSISKATTGHNLATGPIITFRAVGGTWGPVKNLFLANTAGASGYLIASVAMSSCLTANSGRGCYVNDGEVISARMGLGLSDCSYC